MYLYEVNPDDRLPVHVVARTPQEAANLFITWSASKGRLNTTFGMDQLPVENLNAEQQAQVRSAFAAGLIGISHFDEEIGWTFSPPMWQPHDPLTSGNEGQFSVIRVFEMRDPTPIEAFVLATDSERAAELFGMHLQAHGGDPDTLLWREWPVDDLGDPPRNIVQEVWGLHREGLLTCDAEDRWVFITPVGDRIPV